MILSCDLSGVDLKVYSAQFPLNKGEPESCYAKFVSQFCFLLLVFLL